MKVIYAILLVCFFFRGDAQPKQMILAEDKGLFASADTVNAATPEILNNPKIADNKTSTDTVVQKKNTLLGIASFYSPKLEGTETSTGEIFSHKKLTAA